VDVMAVGGIWVLMGGRLAQFQWGLDTGGVLGVGGGVVQVCVWSGVVEVSRIIMAWVDRECGAPIVVDGVGAGCGWCLSRMIGGGRGPVWRGRQVSAVSLM